MINTTLFSQIINRLPRNSFKTIVDRFSGDKDNNRGYESYDLFKKWDEEKITFVVRIKQTTGIIRYKEYPLPEEKHS